jgi:hypothetical protein
MNANHFQEVLLPLHIKLQGLYREKCGDWQIQDDIFDTEYDQKGFILDAPPHSPLNSVLESGLWIRYDLTDKYLLRIPRTIDDSSEEVSKRSLERMLTMAHRTTISSDGTAVVELFHCGFDTGIRTIKANSPTHAILLALCAQEGIEA